MTSAVTASALAMDSQQLVESVTAKEDKVSPKPASSMPRHSIDAILGLANRKRKLEEAEDKSVESQENNG